MNSNWAAAGIGVIALGIFVGSAPIVLIGGGMILIRVIAERWPKRVLESLTYERAIPNSGSILLYIEASVSVSVKVEIDLGLFSITISFSFKASFRFEWQLLKSGSSSHRGSRTNWRW